MRCLVTGARGMLGSELVRWLRQQGEDVTAWDLPAQDVSDVERTIDGIHRVRPDVVFHLAAWTDVDGCEGDPAKATSVNFQGTWGVALGCAELGCRMLYVSTDYVFDGRKGKPYRETDEPNPLCVYGRTKLMGEKAVARSLKKYYIVRTGWLFGRGGKNFVDTVRRLSREKDRLEVVDDQVGSPTYAAHLCRPLWEIASSDKRGIYHVTNGGQCSWCELARKVVELTGAACEVVPIDTAKAGRPAPRPAFSVLENRNFRRRFRHDMRPWQEVVELYVRETPAAQARG